MVKQAEWTSEALRAVQQSIISKLTSSVKKKEKLIVQKSNSLKSLDEEMRQLKQSTNGTRESTKLSKKGPERQVATDFKKQSKS